MIPTFSIRSFDEQEILQHFAGNFTLAELAARVGRPLAEVVTQIMTHVGPPPVFHEALSEALAPHAPDAGATAKRRSWRAHEKRSSIHRQKLDAAVLSVLGESTGWIRPVSLRERKEIRTWLKDPTQSHEISDSLKRLCKAGHRIAFAGSTRNRVVRLG